MAVADRGRVSVSVRRSRTKLLQHGTHLTPPFPGFPWLLRAEFDNMRDGMVYRGAGARDLPRN